MKKAISGFVIESPLTALVTSQRPYSRGGRWYMTT